jgi:hypothetical protein
LTSYKPVSLSRRTLLHGVSRYIVPTFTEWKLRFYMAYRIHTVRLPRSCRLVMLSLTADRTVCLCFCLYYSACKSYLCGAILCLDSQLLSLITLCRISCNYLVNDNFFSGENAVVKIQCIFRISLDLLSEAFANQRSIQRNIRNLHFSVCSVSVLLLVRFEPTDFGENSQHKIS